MNEQLVSFIHHIRFDAFPYVPDLEKAPLFRYLLRFPIHHVPIFEVTKQLLQTNQYQRFVSLVKQAKRNNALHAWNFKKDMDLVLSIYFAELDHELSKTVLVSLLNFQIVDNTSLQHYRIGLNLLFSSTCAQDKLAAIGFLQAV